MSSSTFSNTSNSQFIDMTKLFFIMQSDLNGDNFDLFVRADNEREAVGLWASCYEFGSWQIHDAGLVRAHEIAECSTTGALMWHQAEGVLHEFLIEAAAAPRFSAPACSRPCTPKVHVAVHHSDDGMTRIAAVDSRAKAHAHRDKIVAEKWARWFGDDEPTPSDHQHAAERFFDHAAGQSMSIDHMEGL
jgi:hypothetical protein